MPLASSLKPQNYITLTLWPHLCLCYLTLLFLTHLGLNLIPVFLGTYSISTVAVGGRRELRVNVDFWPKTSPTCCVAAGMDKITIVLRWCFSANGTVNGLQYLKHIKQQLSSG